MWNLDLNLGNFFLSASNYGFMPTLNVDESIFTGQIFVKMHLCGIDFNSTLIDWQIMGSKQKKGDKPKKQLDADTKAKTNILNKQKSNH